MGIDGSKQKTRIGKGRNMIATLEPTTTRRPPPAYIQRLTEAERRIYAEIPEQPDYMDHPSFTSPDIEERLFGTEAQAIPVPEWTSYPEVPEDAPARSSARKALSAKDEEFLFLRYNYARFRLSELAAAQRKRATTPRARQMVAWYRRAQDACADLVQANMALVVAMAKRARVINVEFTELVSEGNMALLRAVAKFDVSRGFKLSTYACRAILKSFSRLATKTGRYRRRFPVEFDPDYERSDYDVKKHEMQHEDALDALGEVLTRNRADLSDVERTIVLERFAIGSDRKKGRTLTEVGEIVGLTRERVRQIQKLAIEKLRVVLDAEYLVA